MGAGFTQILSQRWPFIKKDYRQWFQNNYPIPFSLGQIWITVVNQQLSIYVAHLAAQHGLRGSRNFKSIQYDHLASCLDKLSTNAHKLNASIHIPRMGYDLDEEDWDKIGSLIKKYLLDLDVFIYDLPLNL